MWWTRNKRDDVFWRTSGSGARATTRRKAGKSTFGQCGDVQAVDQAVGQPLIDLLSIEIKRGYNAAIIHSLLDKAEHAAVQPFERFIVQAELDMEHSTSLYWFLITKRDQRCPLVSMPLALAKQLRSLTANTDTKALTVFRAHSGRKYRVFTTTLHEFFEFVSPRTIRKLANK